MEYICEVKFNLDPQFKLFAVKTLNGGNNHELLEQETNFDINSLVIIDSQDFEGEALQLYTDLLIQKLPETRSSIKHVNLNGDEKININIEFFLAKKLINNEELYMFSSNDELNYNAKIGIIHQIMKKTKDSFEMGCQKLFNNDDDMDVCESPSGLSPSRRKLKIKSSVEEIFIDGIHQNFFNELLYSTFKSSLILTNNWFLLSDKSMILSTPVCKRRYNEVTKLLSCTKYQRIYFKKVINSATYKSSDSKCNFCCSFDICFSLPVSRIVSNFDMDDEKEMNIQSLDSNVDSDSFRDLIENSKIINLPTESIMQSEKNIKLFQTILESNFTSISFMVKDKRSVIADILMTTLDNANRTPCLANAQDDNESKENIQNNNQLIEPQQFIINEEVQNKDQTSSDEGMKLNYINLNLKKNIK